MSSSVVSTRTPAWGKRDFLVSAYTPMTPLDGRWSTVCKEAWRCAFYHAVITLGRLKNLRFPTQRCLVSCADLRHYLQMGAGLQGASHRQVGKHQDCPPHLQEQVVSEHQVQQFSVEIMLIGIKEFVSYSAYWGSLKVTAGWDTPWMPSGHTCEKSCIKAFVKLESVSCVASLRKKDEYKTKHWNKICCIDFNPFYFSLSVAVHS